MLVTPYSFVQYISSLLDEIAVKHKVSYVDENDIAIIVLDKISEKGFYDIINQISSQYHLHNSIKEEIIKTSDKKVKIEKYDIVINGIRITIIGDLKEKVLKHLSYPKNEKQKNGKKKIVEKNISVKTFHKESNRNKIKYYENVIIGIYKR